MKFGLRIGQYRVCAIRNRVRYWIIDVVVYVISAILKYS